MKMILRVTVLLVVSAGALQTQRDSASDQIVMFRERNLSPVGVLTTSAGAPVPSDEARSTLNTRLIFNEYFMDSVTHFDRERIPERIVHSKGAGAFGYFEVTHDISNICKAKLFNKIGKKTKVVVRFSHAVEIRGGNELARGVRGLATKFYTEDGIFDLLGINVPVYVYKDPLLFTTFVRSQKQNPTTNIYDSNSLWDFITLQPESLYMFLYVFGDPGIPANYRYMPASTIHTYQVVNDIGDINFVRFHFTPDAGLKYLQSSEGRSIQSVDPDYFTRDLYRAIGTGDVPSWTLNVQHLTLDQVRKAGSSVFDVTRILPVDEYPLKPVGKLVLDKNVLNHFAEVELLAFNPGNLVPGILGGPDTLFEARRLAYRDTQYYRIGPNYQKVSINCPFQSKVLTYNRDGRPPVLSNEKDFPNYYPNSFNGPVPYVDINRTALIDIVESEPNNLQQTIDYVNQMSKGELNRLVENVLESLRPVVKFIQDRAVELFRMVNPELGRRIAQGLLTNKTTNYDTYI